MAHLGVNGIGTLSIVTQPLVTFPVTPGDQDGVIGTLSIPMSPLAVLPPGPFQVRRVVGVCPTSDLMVDEARDDMEGSGGPPCVVFEKPGRYRFRWPVDPGERTITVDCKYAPDAAPRPTLRIRANTEIGVNADLVATAPAGSGWVTIGPLSITPSEKGGVWVELEGLSRADGFSARFDNVVAT
jgi:hypothetical protein